MPDAQPDRGPGRRGPPPPCRTRSASLLAWTLVLALLPAGCGEDPGAAGNGDAGDAAGRPRDVVLIVIDTLRADRLGCYGYHRDTSPFIDDLAANGTRVEKVTAQSSWTAPSMVSMMISRYLKTDFVKVPVSFPTLAERLSEAGFRTAGLQYNILLAPEPGFGRGFDSYEVLPDGRPVKKAVEQIEAVLEDPDPRPLFFYLHLVDPHGPLDPSPACDIFPPEPLDPRITEDFARYLRERNPERDEASIQEEVAAAAARCAEMFAKYDGEVLQADRRVQHVFEVLERTGRLADTLVVIAADHGEVLAEHRQPESELLREPERRDDLLGAFKLGHHTVVFEGVVFTPMIFHGKGIPAGTVLEGPAANVDIAPTILDLLGLPVPADIDGRSLVDAIQAASEGRPARTRPFTYTNTNHFTAVRAAEGGKLIVPWKVDGPDRSFLFDLAADPHESQPLPMSGEVYERLRAELERYRERALDPSSQEDEIDDETRERMRELGYIK